RVKVLGQDDDRLVARTDRIGDVVVDTLAAPDESHLGDQTNGVGGWTYPRREIASGSHPGNLTEGIDRALDRLALALPVHRDGILVNIGLGGELVALGYKLFDRFDVFLGGPAVEEKRSLDAFTVEQVENPPDAAFVTESAVHHHAHVPLIDRM